ncbi:hypothetical protein GLOIN_2v1475593 [Rhizophagus irregularis DAOM 181602=DAOM 197198]|nr:hypothetical protein GLOIN_2v1475593 [Rhizophagus irregularis DAOM 181602=DAOM 197198]
MISLTVCIKTTFNQEQTSASILAPQPLDTQTPVFTYDQIPFQNTPVEPTSEVNPAPDFDIPGDLKPFIPADGQLYLKKSRKKRILLEPDSKQWYAELRRLRDSHDDVKILID